MRSRLKAVLILSVATMLLIIISCMNFQAEINVPQGSGSFKNYDAINSADIQTFKVHGTNGTVFSAIDPYLYKSQPAPMGIADYGLGPDGIPYETNRTSYIGAANISGLSTYNSSWPLNSMGFQLNLNLVFTDSSGAYVFWVQDVALLNTSSHEVQFIDNIWNSSSYTSEMINSSVSGNGSISTSDGTGFYYYEPGNDPGNLVTLGYPAIISLRMNTSVTSQGIPQVNFSYNDGQGWVTYDRVTFPFARLSGGAPVFQVNGFAYKPDYLPMDAEFIMGGPGGGSDTEDISSNISMELDYWNGYNYQAVSNAYNFGSNTAEGISNVSIQFSSGKVSKIPGVTVENGPGVLEMAYNTSSVGFLNLSSPNLQSGLLYVNSTGIQYTNGGANVTLASGSYDIKVVSGLRVIDFGNLTILPDAITAITTVSHYRLNFTETGLPSGTSWKVNVSGILQSSQGDWISFYLTNGTYNYSVSPLPGYTAGSASGEVNVSGSGITILLHFSRIKYEVHVVRNGLISGETWYFNISGTEDNSSVGNSLVIYLPNGTYYYNYTAGNPEYAGNAGSFRIAGSDVYFTVDFEKKGQLVIISDSSSTVFINGNETRDTDRNYSEYLFPGTYYLVDYSPGYSPYSTVFSIDYGETVTLNVTLKEITEYGYLNGTASSESAIINANGIPVAVYNGRFNISLPAGTYIVSEYGNGLSPVTYSAAVLRGQTTYLNASSHTAETFNVSGFVSPGGAGVLFDGIPAMTNSSGFYRISLPPGRYEVSVTAPGYMPQSLNMSVTGSMSHNFGLIPVPANYTNEKYGIVSIESVDSSILGVNYTANSVSITYSTDANGGSMLISVPLNALVNSSLGQVLSSRVYINGLALSNFTVAITGNYTVILELNTHEIDPTITWLLNSSLPAPSHTGSNDLKLISPRDAGPYIALAGLVMILVVAVAVARKRLL